MEQQSDILSHLPPQVYYVLGYFILTHFFQIIGVIKTLIAKESDKKVLAYQFGEVQKTLGTLVAKVDLLDKDLNQAFMKIRTLEGGENAKAIRSSGPGSQT